MVHSLVVMQDDPDGVKSKAFLTWAFGKDFFKGLITNTPDLWNKLHSDIHVIKGSDDIGETMGTISKLYEDHLKKDKA